MSSNVNRAYKACLACRQRKSRCELGEGWKPGDPCRRCHRQMKSCTFPVDRGAAGDRIVSAGPPSLPDTGEASSRVATTTTTSHAPDGGDLSLPVSGYTESDLRPPESDLSDSVMRTMISSGNDALDVLFDPVRRGSQVMTQAPSISDGPQFSHGTSSTTGKEAATNSSALPKPPSIPPNSLGEIWNACRFVKQGWFSTGEAVFFVDKFFTNLQILTPVLTSFFANHEHHYSLISSEPLLCCTILAISVRYHAIPCAGGAMRSFYIHERLWTHIQHLLLRVLLGQEKNSNGKTRSIGTVEALLLLTEWHPRSLSVPPPIDGWDSDLLVHWPEDCNKEKSDSEEARDRWLEDVINPAKRTSHMSWMLTSCAVSLSLELGIFDDSCGNETDKFPQSRYSRVQKLLYIYMEQVSLQHGRQTSLPQCIVRQASRIGDKSSPHENTNTLLKAWSEITKLARLIMETIYPSAAHTSQLLRTGRYHNLMDHFQPMLLSWEDKYLSQSDLDSDFYRHFLRIEYFNTRLYCYSIGLQGIIERSVLQNGSQAGSSDILAGEILDASDYQLVEEVVKCSSEVLMSAVHLGDRQVLQNVPTRVTLRIISGSIFLMKSLGIGIGAAKLHVSLDLLQKAISALGSNAVDELQLGHRYAALLEMHLKRLQSSFIPSQYPRCLPVQTSPGSTHLLQQVPNTQPWFSLPFDATNAMVEMPDLQGFPNFDDGALDFIWNLDFPS